MSIWHYDTLAKFEQTTFKGVLDWSHVKEEIAVKREPFWLLEKNHRRYLLRDDVIEKLPVRPTETKQVIYKSKVYHRADAVESVRIKPEQMYDFKEFVDCFAPAKHSSPDDYLLWKLIVLTAQFSRINVRVCAPHEFGKDSLPRLLHSLCRNMPVITPRSLPAIEYRLGAKALVLNELSDITSDQRHLIQSFLLACGDYSTKYEKPTRGNSGLGTRDEYDISELSLLILFNPLDYYKKIGLQKRFFDRMFTEATCSRYFPIYLQGRLNSDQFINPEKTVSYDELIDWLHTFEYYRQNWSKLTGFIKDEIPPFISGRHRVAVQEILRTIYMYDPEGGDTFNKLTELLFDRHRRYLAMAQGKDVTAQQKSIEVATTALQASRQVKAKDNAIQEAEKLVAQGATQRQVVNRLMQMFSIPFMDALKIYDEVKREVLR